MDKITISDYNEVLKAQLNTNNILNLSMMTQDGNGGQQREWFNVMPTVPSEHPKGPDFDPEFEKMNEEFRSTIRKRQQEEWD